MHGFGHDETHAPALHFHVRGQSPSAPHETVTANVACAGSPACVARTSYEYVPATGNVAVAEPSAATVGATSAGPEVCVNA